MQTTLSPRRDLRRSVAIACVLGLASAFGDWVWARFIPDGAIVPGIVHGVVFFVLLALLLGGAGRGQTSGRLLFTLPAAGLLLAAGFYPLASLLGYLGALLATWIGMWWTLALLLRWAGGREETIGGALVRGLIAAVGSGLAFWAVSGMWTDPAAHPSYLLRALYWTLAFLPGVLALLFRYQPAPRTVEGA